MRSMKILPLFLSFLRVGTFSVGGGYPMLPLIKREVVERHQWVAQDDFLELITVAQAAPGPVSLNVAVFVGYTGRGYKGALAALAGVVLPAFAIIMVVSLFFADFRDNKSVDAVLRGMRPAAVALMVAPLLSMARGLSWWRVGVAAAACACVWLLNISPMWLLPAAAVFGIAVRPRPGSSSRR